MKALILSSLNKLFILSC